MDNKLKVGIISGVVVAIVISTVFASTRIFSNNGIQTSDGNTSIPSAVAEQPCLTKAQALVKTAIKFKEPTQLPGSYELKCADADPYQVSLLYWNQPLTSTNIEKTSMIENGAVSISVERRDAAVDPAYNVKNRTKEIEAMYNDLGPQYKPRLTNILGNLALVREVCDSCGEQTVTFADGSTIVKNFPLPTRIVFYDGDLWYIIEGKLASAELEKMAQSMR